MKRSNRLVIFVGVLLAILAFVGIVIVLNGTSSQQQAQASQPPTVKVLVATQDIAIGDPVTPDKVQVQAVAPNAVVGHAIHDTSQVGGQPALIAIPTGSQVSQEAIAGGSTNISAMLQPGERAIAFQVDRVTGDDFLIQAGDHIDVVVSQSITVLQPTADTVDKPANQQRYETLPGLSGARSVKTILQDKRVLYVSQTRVKSTTQTTATPSPGQTSQQQTQATQIENVIIIIAGTDQDAEVIKFAQNDVSQVGALTAILRNAQDTGTTVQTNGVTIDKLVTDYGLPLPNIVQRQAVP